MCGWVCIRVARCLADHIAPGTKRYLPPRLETLLAWSTLFRSEGTLANYLGYLRTACLVCKAPTKVRDLARSWELLVCSCVQVLDHPALKRARESVSKANNFAKRDRKWIRRPVASAVGVTPCVAHCRARDVVEKLLVLSASRRELAQYGALFLLSYAFLLRLPSEALPAVSGKDGGQSSLFKEGNELVLVLARRKNKQQGSRLVRKCWCAEAKVRVVPADCSTTLR